MQPSSTLVGSFVPAGIDEEFTPGFEILRHSNKQTLTFALESKLALPGTG